MSTISAAAQAPQPTGKALGDRYRAIEAAILAGKDTVTLGDGPDATAIHILAKGGQHKAFHAKNDADVRFKTIVTEEGGYPGKTYLVTYQLSSADGVDNMLHVTTSEENPDWGSPGGPANATTQTLFGAFW